MANNYIEIMKLVNAGNKMGLSNTITRDNGMPLDLSSVQETYEAAVIYAATKAIAYVGQPISVGDKLYIISDTAATTKFVAADGTEYDNFLKEVGTIPTGDNASITVTADGLVSLFGFAGAENGMLPVREDGKLIWKTLEAIGAGDGNDNTTYEFALTDSKTGIIVTPLFNGQPIMEGEEGAQTQKKFELVLDVYTKSEADDKFLAKDDYKEYDDTELADRVTTAEGKITTAEGKITTLEGVVGDAESGLVKAVADEKARAEEAERALGERIDTIDFVDADELADAIKDFATTDYVDTELAKKAEADDLTALTNRVDAFLTGTGATDALDSLQELIAYIDEHDGADLTEMVATIEGIEKKLEGIDTTVVAYVTAAIEAIKIGDYAKAADLTALAGRVEALEAKPFDTYATKGEVETVDAKFAGYTNTEALNGLLAAKADTDTVASTYATKQELADHASDMEDTLESTLAPYAKTADVNASLATKIENTTIAHAVPAVEADPEKGIEAVEGVPEGVTKDGTTLKIVVDAPTRAETIQLIADKVAQVTGGESAADVKLSLEAEVERSTAKDTAHDNALAVLQGDATKVGSVAEAKAAADAAQKTADDATTAINTLTNGQVKTNTDDITAVKGRLTTLETAKGDHETRIAAAEGKITSLETTTGNNATAIGQLQGKDEELVTEDARLAGLISTLQSNKADKSDTYTKGEVDAKVQEAIDAIPDVDFTGYATETYVTDAIAVVNEEVAKKANAADVYTITAADAKFQTEAQVKAIVDKVVADVSETDTIEGLVTLVNYVHDNAGDIAQLVSDVAANRTDIEGNADAIAKNAEDIVAINDWIKTVVQPKASEEISVGTDGTLGINEVNVNKLVQTAGDTLVLNGGDSGVKAE